MLNSTAFRVVLPFIVEVKIPCLSRSGSTTRKGSSTRGRNALGALARRPSLSPQPQSREFVLRPPKAPECGVNDPLTARGRQRRLSPPFNPEAREPPNNNKFNRHPNRPTTEGKRANHTKKRRGATGIQNHFSGTYILPDQSELTARLLRANRHGASGPGPA